MRYTLLLKYLFDKICSFIGIIAVSPAFILVSIILKLQGEDVFFMQKRLGQFGKEFFVYKFTTMPKGSEKLGYLTTINDERPTKLGKILRQTKINEIPQLINVFKGDMSFVGPRPLIKSQIIKFATEESILEYYQMRPGITGYATLKYHHEDHLLAQFDNPEGYYINTIFPDKLALEKEYEKNWSLWLDCKILLLTIKTLFLDKLDFSDKKG